MSRVALVMEGGSLRCMFTAGVTDVFMENSIKYDGVFGVSAGALTGVNIVSEQPGRTAKVNLEYVNDRRYMGINNLILHRSIFNFDFLFGEICDTLVPLDKETFESSPCRYTAVSTSCLTGKPVYSEKSESGDIYAAIRASASLPLLAPMVKVNNEPCLDGGFSDFLPYRKAMDEGYDKIIVVTTREHGYRKKPVTRNMARLYHRAYKKYPYLIKAILSTPFRYNSTLDELDALEKDGKLFVIRPPKPVTISRTEKDVEKLSALYNEGRETGEKLLDALKKYLEG